MRVSLLLLSACSTLDVAAVATAPVPLDDLVDDKSLCGDEDDPDWMEAEALALPEWTDPVGVLTLTDSAGDLWRWCSGALIGPDLLLTAGHCFNVGSGEDHPLDDFTDADDLCDGMEVRFGWETNGGALPSLSAAASYDCVEVIDQRHDPVAVEDYALIRLALEPGNTWGWLEMDIREIVDGEDVYVVGFPSTDTDVNGTESGKKVSPGQVTNPNSQRVYYDADTLGGMSGGAVLDDEGRLIAIHTTGACEIASGNYGRPLDHVHGQLDFLAEHDYFDQDESGNIEAYDLFGAAVAAGDFDGDGYDDLAVGAPWETYGSSSALYAGYVSVRPGSAYGLAPAGEYAFLQGTGSEPETLDQFGSVLAVGDFDGDGYDDLAVGVPDEDGSATGSGEVDVYYGGASGLSTIAQVLTESTAGGTVAANNEFGAALAVGDMNGDGYDDLAIGVPGVGSDAGKVYVMRGSSTGITTTGRVGVQQDLGGGNVESGDRFGDALAFGDFNGDGYDDLAIGAPTEDHPTYGTDAGYLSVFHGSAAGLSTTSGYGTAEGDVTAATDDRFATSLASADLNADGYDDLVMGVPGRDDGGVDAGRVAWRRGRSTGLKGTWSGGTQSPTGSTEAGDEYGAVVVVGDLDGDARPDLAASAPGETVGAGATDGGWVLLSYGTGSTFSTSDTDGVSQDDVAAAGTNDAFGAAMTLGDFDGDGDLDLAVGMPWEDGLDGATQSGAVIVYDVE